MSQAKVSSRGGSGDDSGVPPPSQQTVVQRQAEVLGEHVDEAEALARAAWLGMYQLFRSKEMRVAAAESAAALELTEQQHFALLALPLDDERGLTMRELAELCHTTPSYMTSMIDVLEARGFVGRHPDPEDRRVTRVRLTIDGKGAVYRAHFRLGTPPSGLRDLSLEELRTLSNLMARAAEGYPWP